MKLNYCRKGSVQKKYSILLSTLHVAIPEYDCMAQLYVYTFVATPCTVLTEIKLNRSKRGTRAVILLI